MGNSIFCVRHGEVENPGKILYGRLPIPLTARGYAQAHEAAQLLASRNVMRVITSPVARCMETARIIADALDITLSSDGRLLEALSSVQGIALAEIQKYPAREYSFSSTLGGEAPTDIQARMMDFINSISGELSENVAICSHGDPLYFLYCGIGGWSLPESSEDATESEYPHKGSIRELRVESGKITLGEYLK